MTSHERLYEALHGFFASCSAAGDSHSMDRLDELDLSLSQVKALFALAHADGPLPINVLADRIRLSVAAAGRLVDLLVTAGMVERRESAADRRVKLVTVTAAGRQATDAHIEAKKAAMRSQVERLSDAESERLVAALQPLLTPRTLEQEIPA